MYAKTMAVLLLAGGMMSTALADRRGADFDYPGSWAIADGNGKVEVKVQYLPQAACWRIASAREGVPSPELDQPTGRMLYVTVQLEKTDTPCVPVNNPLETRLSVPDKPGRISLDVFIVDERGVLQRSQRHRIDRDCGAATTATC